MEGLLGFKKYFSKFKRRAILDNYYTRKIKKGKSVQATFLDWVVATITVILFLLILINRLTNNFLLTIVLAAAIVGLYTTILKLWNKRVRHKKINEINNDLANKQLTKEIFKYGNREFLLYVKELLEKYYNTTFFEYDKYIDFIGEINGEIYGVKCFKNASDNRVSLKNLEHFIREMKNLDIKEGIIVTSSCFTEEVKENLDYLLVDFDLIKNMLRKIGAFPTKEDIEESIINKYNSKKDNIKERLKIKDKDKIYKFIILGISLYFISFFVLYKLYYRVMAFISIGIGLIIGLYNTIVYIKGIRKDY